MSGSLDVVDKRILYILAGDARNPTAPSIAQEVDVSASTVRNRISRLEDEGFIRGYHASIDYQRIEGRLTALYICTSSVSNRSRLSKQVAEISGVTNVRELLKGRRNLHVTAVGKNPDDLDRITNDLSSLGLEIEEENLLRGEQILPYDEFGPRTPPTNQ